MLWEWVPDAVLDTAIDRYLKAWQLARREATEGNGDRTRHRSALGAVSDELKNSRRSILASAGKAERANQARVSGAGRLRGVRPEGGNDVDTDSSARFAMLCHKLARLIEAGPPGYARVAIRSSKTGAAAIRAELGDLVSFGPAATSDPGVLSMGVPEASRSVVTSRLRELAIRR